MGPTKTLVQGLAALLLISMSAIAVAGRIEAAQPTDAGATAKKTADLPAKQELQEQYLKRLQTELLNRQSQLTAAKLELSTIKSQLSQRRDLEMIITDARETLRRQYEDLKGLAKQRNTLEEYAALKREAALLRSQLNNAQVRLEIYMATKLQPGDKLSVPDYLVDKNLDLDPRIHMQLLEVAKAQERVVKAKQTSKPGSPYLSGKEEELRNAEQMLVTLRAERRAEIVKRMRQKIRDEAETGAGKLQQEIKILQRQKEEMDNEIKQIGGEAARIGSSSIELERKRADIEQAESKVKQLQHERENLWGQLQARFGDNLSTARKAAEDRVAFLTRAEKELAAKYNQEIQRLVEAGDPLTTQKAADLAQKLDEARRQAERARDEAEALRRQVEQEREKAVQAAREAAAQRDAAQLAEAKARQQAERALAEQAAARRAAEQALQQARNATERATYAAQVRAAQDAFARQKDQAAKDGQGDVDKDLERAKRVLQRRFDMQREELTNQLKHLEVDQQRMLADLQKKAEIMRERAQRQGERGGPSSSGKLDQILERLQRIEMRLDRLERSRPGESPQHDK